MFKQYLMLVVFLVTINLSSPLPLVSSVRDCAFASPDAVRIFMTISSLYVSTTEEGIVERQLEVNWIGRPSSGAVIGVFRQDPAKNHSAEPEFVIDPAEHPDGFYRTNIALPVKLFDLKTISADQCLGFWAALQSREGKILVVSCLDIHPHWMEQSGPQISNLRLDEIMIPGSHDSGSFYFREEKQLLQRYKYAQEESIFNQLVYGIRYFDLRVGHYPSSQYKFYINHNFLRTEHSVKSVLHQVREFLDATKEVVILDFHNFPVGFKSDLTHKKLQRLVLGILGHYIIPHNETSKNLTFSDFWGTDKRVLISYGDLTRDKWTQNTFWPDILRAWGNKQAPEDLKEYFEEFFVNPPNNIIWAAMAELTPDTKTIILHPETGLRVLAELVNRNVTHWFRDLYWQKSNIVATDFFLGNDIIEVSIRANRIKGVCPMSSWAKFSP